MPRGGQTADGRTRRRRGERWHDRRRTERRHRRRRQFRPRPVDARRRGPLVGETVDALLDAGARVAVAGSERLVPHADAAAERAVSDEVTDTLRDATERIADQPGNVRGLVRRAADESFESVVGSWGTRRSPSSFPTAADRPSRRARRRRRAVALRGSDDGSRRSGGLYRRSRHRRGNPDGAPCRSRAEGDRRQGHRRGARRRHRRRRALCDARRRVPTNSVGSPRAAPRPRSDTG